MDISWLKKGKTKFNIPASLIKNINDNNILVTFSVDIKDSDIFIKIIIYINSFRVIDEFDSYIWI